MRPWCDRSLVVLSTTIGPPPPNPVIPRHEESDAKRPLPRTRLHLQGRFAKNPSLRLWVTGGGGVWVVVGVGGGDHRHLPSSPTPVIPRHEEFDAKRTPPRTRLDATLRLKP